MIHILILKVTKFQLPPGKRLSTVIKNILGGMMPPMSNSVEVKQFVFHQILPVNDIIILISPFGSQRALIGKAAK